MVGPVMKPDTSTPPSSEMLFAVTIELFGLLVREKIAPAGVFPGTPSLLRATTDQPLASPFTSTTWFAVAPRFVMPGPAMRPRKYTVPFWSIVGLLNWFGTHTAPVMPLMFAGQVHEARPPQDLTQSTVGEARPDGRRTRSV